MRGSSRPWECALLWSAPTALHPELRVAPGHWGCQEIRTAASASVLRRRLCISCTSGCAAASAWRCRSKSSIWRSLALIPFSASASCASSAARRRSSSISALRAATASALDVTVEVTVVVVVVLSLNACELVSSERCTDVSLSPSGLAHGVRETWRERLLRRAATCTLRS